MLLWLKFLNRILVLKIGVFEYKSVLVLQTNILKTAKHFTLVRNSFVFCFLKSWILALVPMPTLSTSWWMCTSHNNVYDYGTSVSYINRHKLICQEKFLFYDCFESAIVPSWILFTFTLLCVQNMLWSRK